MDAPVAIAALAGLLALAVPADAESLLALQDGDTLTLWDTTTSPATARMTGLTGGTPGACYVADGNRLVPDGDITACLGHLNITYDPVTGGAAPYDITGVIAAVEGPLDDYSTGFAVTGVRGIDACGERDDCSTIYIIGTRGAGTLEALADAARSGAKVRVRGPGAWNFESIDIIIDDISSAR